MSSWFRPSLASDLAVLTSPHKEPRGHKPHHSHPGSRARCRWSPQRPPYAECGASLHLIIGHSPSVGLLPWPRGRLRHRQGQVSHPSSRSLDVEWGPDRTSGGTGMHRQAALLPRQAITEQRQSEPGLIRRNEEVKMLRLQFFTDSSGLST